LESKRSLEKDEQEAHQEPGNLFLVNSRGRKTKHPEDLTSTNKELMLPTVMFYDCEDCHGAVERAWF
jgi:hypothetical protein